MAPSSGWARGDILSCKEEPFAAGESLLFQRDILAVPKEGAASPESPPPFTTNGKRLPCWWGLAVRLLQTLFPSSPSEWILGGPPGAPGRFPGGLLWPEAARAQPLSSCTAGGQGSAPEPFHFRGCPHRSSRKALLPRERGRGGVGRGGSCPAASWPSGGQPRVVCGEGLQEDLSCPVRSQCWG